MKELRGFLEELNDYIKEISLCGITNLNDRDVRLLLIYEEKAISLGLSFGFHIIKKIRENIYNVDEFILLICELKEYIGIMRFKIM